MKIFNRRIWGTVLIWLGVLILIALLIDSIRPYFPREPAPVFSGRPADNLLKQIGSLFTRSDQTEPAEVRPTRPPPRRPVPPDPRAEGLLTANRHQPQYEMWVWAVEPEQKTGPTVILSIAHAAPGRAGAFRMLAYADTEKDGLPDELIARSPLLTAENQGVWSSWTFRTDEERIFVGKTWPMDQEGFIYRDNGPFPEGPFSEKFFWRAEGANSRMAGPAFTNMRIEFAE